MGSDGFFLVIGGWTPAFRLMIPFANTLPKQNAYEDCRIVSIRSYPYYWISNAISKIFSYSIAQYVDFNDLVCSHYHLARFD